MRSAATLYSPACLPSRPANAVIAQSALYHKALISTGLPMRGVTTQIADTSIHPGQLHALFAGMKQPVGRINSDAVARAGEVAGNDLGEHREDMPERCDIAA